jgi:lactate dehydrogenase-like 2-hydroxyacid dehydrogenase
MKRILEGCGAGELEGKGLLVAGLGAIGTEIARLGSAFDSSDFAAGTDCRLQVVECLDLADVAQRLVAAPMRDERQKRIRVESFAGR